jgi:putative redox protein
MKTASVTLDGDGSRFVGRTGSGHEVIVDDSNGDAGPRPSELVPLALAACTAMDVIAILRKKRQDVSRYEVRAKAAQREQTPTVFTRIDLVHEVEGTDVDIEAVRRAIELSATRYCTVGSTLSTGVTEIHHAYVVTDSGGGRHTGEVVVLGPEGKVLVLTPVATA